MTIEFNKILFNLSIASCLALTGANASTFIDKKTGLMWQDTKDTIEEPTTYDDAIEYCKKLPLEGYSDWRVPTITELKSIVDYNKYDPAIIDGFKNVLSDYYWSSSPNVSGSSGAWFVYFSNGYDYWGNKSNSRLVRCVRDSKETLQIDSFSSLLEKAQKYEIDKKLDEPQKKEIIKGQFEKTADFEARVAKEEERYEKAMAEYKTKYEAFLIKSKKKAILKSLQIYYGKPFLKGLEYDADKETFSGDLKFENDDTTIDIKFKMPPKEAEKFYNSYENLKYEVVFESDKKSIKGKKLQFMFDKKLYTIALLEEDGIEHDLSDDE